MFRLIDEEKTHHSVSRMARLLGVSRQGYYKHTNRAQQGPGPRERANTELAGRIRTHHERSRGTYGTPRVSRSTCANATASVPGATGSPG